MDAESEHTTLETGFRGSRETAAAGPAAEARARTTERREWAGYLYIAPAFILIFMFTLVSMGLSFWTSLHEWDAFAGSGRFVGADNYRRVLFAPDSAFWTSLRNTTLYVLMVLAGMLVTA